ncbi:hypothetical protein ACP70R_032117 [Stipagrostis hirtigluma subsp. patula]
MRTPPSRLLRCAMGGGGGGMEVDLSRGAVARLAEGLPLRPVLQVAEVARVAGGSSAAGAERYRILLSDGVHSQPGFLASSLNHLVSDGALRRGTVVRLLDYICSFLQGRRFIIVVQLEILQTECALVGSPTSYDPNGISCSRCIGSHEPCFMPGAQQVVNTSCFPGRGMLDSSIAPRAEHAVNNQPFGGCYVSVPSQNMVDAKMQQLSLDDHQNQIFAVTTPGGVFSAPGGTYGSAMPPTYLLSPPMCSDRSHVSMTETPYCITPISALNPYQTRWTIKARVTSKTNLRHYDNARGPGKFFSFDLLDAQGGEIRATCFNLQAGQYFDQIVVDKVYIISKGAVKPAQKKFNQLNNEYEIFVDYTTCIEICSGGDSSIPRQQCVFRQISEIANMENGAIVDLVGIVMSVSPPVTIMQKNGVESQKRTLLLKDMSSRSVEITLWGAFCDAEGHQLQSLCDVDSNPVLTLKGGCISDFRGRSVCTIRSTQLKINPDFPEAERLRHWYVTEGKAAACISLSQESSSMRRTPVWKTVSQIMDENIGLSDMPAYVTVEAVISHVNADSFCYPACILDFNGMQCQKKVTKNSDGTWYCRRCHQNSPNCEYRYLLLCQIKDHTGVTNATAYHEAGMDIIGCNAQDLLNLRDQDAAQFKEIMQGVGWQQYLFNLRVKEPTFNWEWRARCSILTAKKSDMSNVSHLMEEIDGLLKHSSCSTSEDASCYVPDVGFADLCAKHCIQASNNAYGYATSVGGAVYGAC